MGFVSGKVSILHVVLVVRPKRLLSKLTKQSENSRVRSLSCCVCFALTADSDQSISGVKSLGWAGGEGEGWSVGVVLRISEISGSSSHGWKVAIRDPLLIDCVD